MFSIGIAPAHPFLMSEQSPRIIKLRQSVYARSNIQPLRQTEISILHQEPVHHVSATCIPLIPDL